MGNSILGALRVTLGLDTVGFEKGAQKAKHEAEGLGAQLHDLGKEFAPLVFEMGAALAVVELFRKGMEKAGETAKYAYDLIGQKQKLGVGVEALQELRHAGEESHIPIEQLEAGLNGLNSTLGALRTRVGDGRIRKAFDELGIPQSTLKTMKTADDLLPILADHLVALGNHADQVQIAKKLQVEELLPLLLKGSAGIADLRDEARKLGIVMGEETVERLSEMNHEMKIADERSEAAGRRLSQNLVPVLRDIKNAAADAAGALASMLSWANAHDDNNLDFKIKQHLASAQGLRNSAQTVRTGSTWDAMWAGNASGLEMTQPGWREKIAQRLDQEAARQDAEVQRISQEVVAAAQAAADAAGAAATDGAGNGAFKDHKTKAGKKLKGLTTLAEETIDRSTIVDPSKIAMKPKLNEFKTALEEAAHKGVMDGLNKAMEENYLNVREMWRSTIQGGVQAFVTGGGKGLMHYLADQFRERLLSRLTDGLLHAFDGFIKQSASGTLGSGGGGFGSILAFGSKLMGFADGGSFRVGGSGGIDSQLVSMRLSPGEMVDVRHGDQAAGIGGLAIYVDKSKYFDVEVQRVAGPMAAQAAAYGEQAGAIRVEKMLQRRARQTLG